MVIEKEFTMVLYADSKFNQKGLPEYYLNTVQENTSAKCPPDIFGADVVKVDNDANLVFNKILEFCGVDFVKTIN